MFVETSAKKIPVSSGRAASRCTMSAAFSFGPISLLTELTHVIYADSINIRLLQREHSCKNGPH